MFSYHVAYWRDSSRTLYFEVRQVAVLAGRQKTTMFVYLSSSECGTRGRSLSSVIDLFETLQRISLLTAKNIRETHSIYKMFSYLLRGTL